MQSWVLIVFGSVAILPVIVRGPTAQVRSCTMRHHQYIAAAYGESRNKRQFGPHPGFPSQSAVELPRGQPPTFNNRVAAVVSAVSNAMADVPASQTSGVPVSETKKRNTRPNPARRKASKAKALKDGDQESVDAASRLPAVTRTDEVKENASPKQKPRLARRQTELPEQQRPTAARRKSEPSSKLESVSARQESDLPPKASTPTRDALIMMDKPERKTNGTLALTGPALATGGLLGCAASAAVLLGVHLWYEFAGAEQAILVAKSAKLCVNNMADEIITSQKAGTYSADEALDVLRRTTLAYAGSIPGGAPFVERIFQEVNMVRKQRGQEVDRVLREAYVELTFAAARSATAVNMRNIILSKLVKLSGFASRSVQDIVARNPQLRSYRDGVVRSVQGMPGTKVPTLQLNMAVRQKLPAKP